MEELQRKLDQHYEGTKPRKLGGGSKTCHLQPKTTGEVQAGVVIQRSSAEARVRGRQELDSPEEKYPHSFVHRKIPPATWRWSSSVALRMLMGTKRVFILQQGSLPREKRVQRNGKLQARCRPDRGSRGRGPMLDFGKIIIYTSNLRIIRAPPRKPEVSRHHTGPPLDLEGYPKARERGSRRRAKALCAAGGEEKEEKPISDTETKEADSCQHCGALSMLANRFNESISDLRCQACYPHGLEKCQSCSSK
ncbi:hypothetical protein F7725_006940 [Dissostichus mawsoni]|uniref:Uncharacterized protein n=1 Tax=Dissostichus mawsoni TaxID=36200 RepID=A0A7J5XYA3_DISMA|nr:hypothetical protein F7725_006940 [Dissostichus mawsoni]